MTRAMLALLLAATTAPTAGGLVLSGKVLGASGKGTVHIALWQSDGFLKHPTAEVHFDPGNSTSFHFDVLPGRYALSAFEDLNGNGILDMGMFGPKEPTGFWRPFRGWHRPRFEEVATLFQGDTRDLDIVLK